MTHFMLDLVPKKTSTLALSFCPLEVAQYRSRDTEYYLSRHSQKTQFRDILSEVLPVSVGMPQGSILGSLFLIIHINDLPLVLHSDITSTRVLS